MGKNPFTHLDLFESDRRNVTGTNSGNMLFAESVFKTLSIDGTTIDRHGYTAKPAQAGAINEKYDALVLPMANSFRNKWKPSLEQFCDLIEQLTIPVVVVGVGAQTNLDYDLEKLAPIADVTKRFVKAVLNRSSSIGVRGECTASFLKSLGFPEDSIEVIGCPSMFMYGGNLPIPKQVPEINTASKISINVTSTHKTGTFRDGLDTMLDMADAHIRKYPNSILVCQEGRSLNTMLWGRAAGRGTEYDGISVEAVKALDAGGRARFFVDPQTWFDELSSFDYSFGTRLHGNISALLGGTPCTMIATDSRTRELAELFNIPWRRVDQVNGQTDVSELAAQADFSKMTAGHRARFEVYRQFMKRNDLPFSYDTPQTPIAFDKELKASSFAPAARGVNQDPIIGQFAKSRSVTNRIIKNLTRRVSRLEKRLAKQS